MMRNFLAINTEVNVWLIIIIPIISCILPIILFLTDPANRKQHPPL